VNGSRTQRRLIGFEKRVNRFAQNHRSNRTKKSAIHQWLRRRLEAPAPAQGACALTMSTAATVNNPRCRLLAPTRDKQSNYVEFIACCSAAAARGFARAVEPPAVSAERIMQPQQPFGPTPHARRRAQKFPFSIKLYQTDSNVVKVCGNSLRVWSTIQQPLN
jgi:hypothetical protein